MDYKYMEMGKDKSFATPRKSKPKNKKTPGRAGSTKAAPGTPVKPQKRSVASRIVEGAKKAAAGAKKAVTGGKKAAAKKTAAGGKKAAAKAKGGPRARPTQCKTGRLCRGPNGNYCISANRVCKSEKAKGSAKPAKSKAKKSTGSTQAAPAKRPMFGKGSRGPRKSKTQAAPAKRPMFGKGSRGPRKKK